MHRLTHLVLVASALAVFFIAPPAQTQSLDNLFFLHHSTGQNLVNQGDVRDWLADHNADHGAQFEFWDHDYNQIGLRADDGDYVGWNYNIPNNNTDPIGLYNLWTTANAARDSILSNHEVIAFKSCYPASAIETPPALAQYKIWYLAMRDVFDLHPDKVFVVMSPPPLHRLSTNLTEADNARAFADWLKSPAYLAGHPNLVCFDLFDAFAEPDDAESDTRNMLRYEFEISHSTANSHPNPLANSIVGPQFMAAMVAAAQSQSSTAAPTPSLMLPTMTIQPNPFNPTTVVAFDLRADTQVTVEVFDLRGHLVRGLLEDRREAGRYQVRWDGRDDRGEGAPAGVYLCRLQAGDEVVTRRMALVR